MQKFNRGGKPGGKRNSGGRRDSSTGRDDGFRKKSFRKNEGDRPFKKSSPKGDKEFSEERKFKSKDDGERSSEKREGKRSFGKFSEKREGKFSSERRFKGGDKKERGFRDGGFDRGERKFGEKRKFSGDRKFGGEKKNYKDFRRKDENRSDDKYSERSSGENERGSGEGRFERGERKFGGKRKFSGERKFDGEKKPYKDFRSRNDDKSDEKRRERGDEKFSSGRKFGEGHSGEKRRSGNRRFSKDNREEDFGQRRDFEQEAEESRHVSKKPKWGDSPQNEQFGKKRFGKKKQNTPEPSADGLTRLNKYLANAGIASRREADTLIKSGAVKVNDVVITEMGYKIKSGDKVTYGDAPVKGEKKVYILLNKPKDYITTVDDPRERHTVMELIAGACRERVYPVGRLDRNTTGILLLTNDGDLTKKLTHPKYGIKKVYKVTLSRSLKPEDYSSLLEGVELEDGLMKVDDVAFPGEGRKEVGIEIHSGRNRIVRRLFEHLGYDVIKLDRVVFAGLTKKDLPRGKYRFLTQKEVSFLQMIG